MTAPASSLPPLGPLIRMRPLKPAELPVHPLLASLQSKGAPPPLKEFIAAALTEGHAFLTGYLPKTFKVKAEAKPAPPSTAPVELLAHEISAHDLPEEGRTLGASETWFARTSIHENAAKDGTASWEEFDSGLRADHSQHEQDYTPGIVDVHKVLGWEEELGTMSREVDGWKEVDAMIMEMVHKMPFPLSKRVFNVLVISARKDQEFIDVQIPIDTSKISEARYKNDSNVTTGMYCSVERGELLEGTKVKWQMATASNAKGVLPMWAQKLGVPGAIIKDVGLFIEWRARTRKGKS